jgi:antitoxin MazE
METTIQKWGNSLGVRLPKDVADKLALRAGSRVELKEGKEGLVIRRTPRARPSLRDLVRLIRRDNLHHEAAWGSPRGTEAW